MKKMYVRAIAVLVMLSALYACGKHKEIGDDTIVPTLPEDEYHEINLTGEYLLSYSIDSYIVPQIFAVEYEEQSMKEDFLNKKGNANEIRAFKINEYDHTLIDCVGVFPEYEQETYDWWRVGNLHLDVNAFQTIMANSMLCQIIGRDLLDEDILFRAILEISPHSIETFPPPGTQAKTYFWIHTKKGNFFLYDNWEVDNDMLITHNWIAYTTKELMRLL
jgi:hypothetical protein